MTATTTLVGNLTRDPELRFTASGQAVVSFSLAVNRRRKDKATGQYVDETPSFFDVTAWGDMAERVSESLTKGTRVIVVGRLEQRSWENEAGEKRTKVEVVADEVGASLRWANVAVQRIERQTGGAEQQGGEWLEEKYGAKVPATVGDDPF